MTEKMKTTAPLSSVGADGAQPQLKNHSEIIANETAQINLQAAQNPENPEKLLSSREYPKVCVNLQTDVR